MLDDGRLAALAWWDGAETEHAHWLVIADPVPAQGGAAVIDWILEETRDSAAG